MTEAEWLACTDPVLMLWFLRSKSDRKTRLCAAACCRLVSHLLIDRRSRETITLAERLADDSGNRKEARLADRLGLRGLRWVVTLGEKYERAGRAVRILAALDRYNTVGHVIQYAEEAVRAENLATTILPRAAGIVRDLFGNPFAPIAVPVRLTATAYSLAQSIYIDRAFDRLPILGDALEDAGCTNRDILDHCRQPGEHVRGCWVVDLVLGKS